MEQRLAGKFTADQTSAGGFATLAQSFNELLKHHRIWRVALLTWPRVD
jgi:hypothetical protein